MDKILSVIIPTYNMSSYLERCLNSLVSIDSNLLPLLHIIVVNDESKDDSLDIAQTFALNFPGIVDVIDKNNGHYGSCINVALPCVKGRYVKILDADDCFNSVSLSKVLCYLNNLDGEVDLLLTEVTYVNLESGEQSTSVLGLPTDKKFDISELTAESINDMHMHFQMYNASIFQNHCYYQTEGQPYTDLEWTYYPMQYVKSILYLEYPLYVYSVSREGQSCDDNNHCQNMHFELDVIEKMSFYYSNEYLSVSGFRSDEYMFKKLFFYIERVYYYYLIHYPYQLKQSDLRLFTKHINHFFPWKKYLSDSVITLHRLGQFRFILHWNRTLSRINPIFILNDIQEGIVKLKKRVL